MKGRRWSSCHNLLFSSDKKHSCIEHKINNKRRKENNNRPKEKEEKSKNNNFIFCYLSVFYTAGERGKGFAFSQLLVTCMSLLLGLFAFLIFNER